MSLKPLRLLSTFCWHSLWGLRRPHVFLFLFLNSQLQKIPEPLPFGLQAAVWVPASLFSFVFFPVVTLRGTFRSPLDPSPLPHLHAYSYSLHSKMWCFDFFFCFVLFLYCFCVEFFPFLLRLCPEKNKFCMFPAVSSHLRIYIYIYIYISPSPLCFL